MKDNNDAAVCLDPQLPMRQFPNPTQQAPTHTTHRKRHVRKLLMTTTTVTSKQAATGGFQGNHDATARLVAWKSTICAGNRRGIAATNLPSVSLACLWRSYRLVPVLWCFWGLNVLLPRKKFCRIHAAVRRHKPQHGSQEQYACISTRAAVPNPILHAADANPQATKNRTMASQKNTPITTLHPLDVACSKSPLVRWLCRKILSSNNDAVSCPMGFYQCSSGSRARYRAISAA